MPDVSNIDTLYLQQAIRLAIDSVADGGGPFGAVIVRDGDVVATGQNRVTRDHDPTAHAEVTAIRATGAALGDFSLAGCTLYSSCEPCPMCMSAALWARVDRVVYAADRYDAAEGGFDDLAFYEALATPREQWDLKVHHCTLAEGSVAPFRYWLESESRVAY